MPAFESSYTLPDRVSFIESVENYSAKLGIDPSWWMFMFDLESGLNPNIENSIGCVGLNQMCPDYSGGSYKTVGGKRIDLATFKAMNGTKQMDIIYEFFKPKAGQFKNFKDLYLYNFLPGYFGRDESTVLPSWAIPDNPAFDVNKDGKFTIKELNGYLEDRARRRVGQEYLSAFFNPETNEVTQFNFFQRHERDIVVGGILTFALVMAGVIAYFLLRR